MTYDCIICGKPVSDYVPTYCCSGRDCACEGMPIDPCCCSLACEDAVYKHIGEPYDVRRQLEGIDKWTE